MTLLSVMLVSVTAPLITPAWACGCGAYAPEHGGTATVPMETALVRVNADVTEDIYLSLSVDSTVRTGALLFPVPDKAATVAAGPTDLFAELARVTTPPPPKQEPGNGGNAGAAPGSGVTVVNRQRIGPLDVVTLTSGDPTALTQWLQTHGFAAKPALAAAAKPYTDQGWAFVAIRLRPEAASRAALKGTLDPLHIHFASQDAVYPMRLSAMASAPEQVRVYTLAAHRLELGPGNPGMATAWAGRLGGLSGFPDLAKVAVTGSNYLTRFDGTLSPASISDDFHFRRAASDSEVRRDAEGREPDSSANGSSHDDNTLRDVALGIAALAVVILLALGVVRWQTRRPRSG
jgi:hypothetical protein